MGYYINPATPETKLDFLERVGIRVTEADVIKFDYHAGVDFLPVILLDRGAFQAAGILLNFEERSAAVEAASRALRPTRYYFVERRHLAPWMPEK